MEHYYHSSRRSIVTRVQLHSIIDFYRFSSISFIIMTIKMRSLLTRLLNGYWRTGWEKTKEIFLYFLIKFNFFFPLNYRNFSNQWTRCNIINGEREKSYVSDLRRSSGVVSKREIVRRSTNGNVSHKNSASSLRALDRADAGGIWSVHQ